MRGLSIAVVFVLPMALAAQDSVVPPHRLDARTAAAFETWITAVNEHQPGMDDAPLETVAAFSMVQRADLSAGMSLFVRGLENKGALGSLEDAQMRVTLLGLRAAQHPDMLVFLKRAALLHADAAIARPSNAIDAGPPDAAPGSRRREPAAETPLLTQHRLPAGEDGRGLGEVVASWHWPFARFLLDIVEAAHPRDTFVAAWYHATSALLLARRAYGELAPQLERARTLLPADPHSLFDRACYAETLGLPVVQAFVEDRPAAPPRGASMNWTARPPPALSGIPDADVANGEAERLFRRVLAIDGTYVEARVRLARMLDLRGRHDEALTQLTAALAGAPAAPVAFYAHLFAGRAAQNLGQLAPARDHYAAALALFPGAQSASLGLSQVEVLRADVRAALAPLRAPRSDEPPDPWWKYHLGAGRDVEALLAALRTSLAR
jgi:tetratricopeptide (TPR) repeat protein